MKKALILIIVLIISLVLLLIIVGGENKKTLQNNQSDNNFISKTPIFFYGNTCPYCKNVEQWIKENKIEEKINLTKKEIYNNKDNALEFEKAAKSCGLITSTIGVPFLYTPEGRCFMGSYDVINYLKEKAGLKPDKETVPQEKISTSK